jgi:hypothetical protein
MFGMPHEPADDPKERTKHLGLILEIIARMAGHALLLKGWTVTNPLRVPSDHKLPVGLELLLVHCEVDPLISHAFDRFG